MASLANQTISSTYDGLIKTSSDNAVGVSGVTLLEDGAGNSLALSVGRANNGVTVTGSLNATLATAAQTNITSVGTLTSLTVSGNILSTASSGVFIDNVSGGSNSLQARIKNSSGDMRIGIESSTGGTMQVGTSANAAVFGNQGNYNTEFTTNGTLRMTIDNSGNVGIGASPVSKLTVMGDITVNIGQGFYTNTYYDGGFKHLSNGYAGYFAMNAGDGSFVWTTAPSGTAGSTANLTERMRIDSSGTVSIAKNTNSSTLPNTPSTHSLTLYPPTSTGYYGGGISWSEGTNTAASINAVDDGAGGALGLVLSTGNNTTISERMRIDSSGNVGVGTSSPSAAGASYRGLDIRGSGGGSIRYGVTSGFNMLTYATGTATDFVPSAASDIRFFNKTGVTESIRFQSGGGISFNGDTAAANALDDYEEGTWTMGISFGGASAGVSYQINAGTYTKIGRQVTATGYLIITDKGSSTGNAKITGLPYTIANGNAFYPSATVGYLQGISFADTLTAFGDISSTDISLYETTNGGAASSITDADFVTLNYAIIITITYFTA